MASCTSATTQSLVNNKCLIDRELFLRRFHLHGAHPEHSGAVTLYHIPRGYHTLDVYYILAAYGSIRRIQWLKDGEGYELNRMTVVYWNYEDARHLRETGFHMHDHAAFRRDVRIE